MSADQERGLTGVSRGLRLARPEWKSPAVDPADHDQFIEAASRLRMVIVPLSRQLHRQIPAGYTPTQLSVLSTVNRHGPIRLGELATRERLSLPRISNVISDLEAAGMIERYDDDDGRVVLVNTTDTARSWIESNRRDRDRWLATKLTDLSATELAAVPLVIALLERLIEESRPPEPET